MPGAQLVEEFRDAPQRVVAGAAEAAVDGGLQRRAQRAKGDRHDQRRDRR